MAGGQCIVEYTLNSLSWPPDVKSQLWTRRQGLSWVCGWSAKKGLLSEEVCHFNEQLVAEKDAFNITQFCEGMILKSVLEQALI